MNPRRAVRDGAILSHISDEIEEVTQQQMYVSGGRAPYWISNGAEASVRRANPTIPVSVLAHLYLKFILLSPFRISIYPP